MVETTAQVLLDISGINKDVKELGERFKSVSKLAKGFGKTLGSKQFTTGLNALAHTAQGINKNFKTMKSTLDAVYAVSKINAYQKSLEKQARTHKEIHADINKAKKLSAETQSGAIFRNKQIIKYEKQLIAYNIENNRQKRHIETHLGYITGYEKEILRIKKQQRNEEKKLTGAKKEVLTVTQKVARQDEMYMAKAKHHGRGLLALQVRLIANYKIMNVLQQTFSRAIRDVVQFDAAMRQVQAIANVTEKEFKELSQTVRTVSRATKFSGIEVAEAAKILAQAGYSIAEIGTLLESTTKLASATGEDLASTTAAVTSALEIYNLHATQSASVTDKFTTAINTTKLTLPKIQAGLQYTGNVAAGMGVSFEETLGIMGAMAQAGIRTASMFGTGPRALFAGLAKPSKQALEVFQNLGLSMEDLNVESKGLVPVLKKLKAAGFGVAEAMAAFDRRGGAAYLAIANNIDTVDQMRLAFAETGSTLKASDRQMKSLANSGKKLQAAIANLLSEAFQPLIESLADIATGLAKVIEYISDIINVTPGLKQVLSVATAVAVTFIGVKVAMAGIATALASVQALMITVGTLSKGAGLLTLFSGGAAALPIAAIAALTAGVYALSKSLSGGGGVIEAYEYRLNKLQETTSKEEVKLRTLSEMLVRTQGRFVDLSGNTEDSKVEMSIFIAEAIKGFEDLGMSIDNPIEKTQDLLDVTIELQAKQSEVALEARKAEFREKAQVGAELAKMFTDMRRAEEQTKYMRAVKAPRSYYDKSIPHLPEKLLPAELDISTQQNLKTAEGTNLALTQSAERATGLLRLHAKDVEYMKKYEVMLRKIVTLARELESSFRGIQEGTKRTEFFKGEKAEVSGKDIKLTKLLMYMKDSREHLFGGEFETQLKALKEIAEKATTPIEQKTEIEKMVVRFRKTWLRYAGNIIKESGAELKLEKTKLNASEKDSINKTITELGSLEKDLVKYISNQTTQIEIEYKKNIQDVTVSTKTAKAIKGQQEALRDSFETNVEKTIKKQSKIINEFFDSNLQKMGRRESRLGVSQTLYKQSMGGATRDRDLAKKGLRPDKLDFVSEQRRVREVTLRTNENLQALVLKRIEAVEVAQDSFRKEFNEASLRKDWQSKVQTTKGLTREGASESDIKKAKAEERTAQDTYNKYLQTTINFEKELFDLEMQKVELQAQKTQNLMLLETELNLTKNLERATAEWMSKTSDQITLSNFARTMMTQTFASMELGMGRFVESVTNGTAKIKDAFKDMAISILKAMHQLASQKAAQALLMLGMSFIPTGGASAGPALAADQTSLKVTGWAQGGLIPKKFAGGGSVSGKDLGRDSVYAMLRPNEFVMQKSAVDLLGKDVMESINMGNIPVAPIPVGVDGGKEGGVVNVWVVSPDQQPTMGPNDVLATVGENITNGGSIKQLIKTVVVQGRV